MLPVAESVCVVLGVATDHCDEGEGEHNEDQDDLAARQPEFSFAEDFDCKNVEDAIEDDTGKRNGPWRDVVTPEVKDSGQSSDFEGDQKSFVDED